MKNSGIGGQALMEGVMMRNGGEYACSVRKPDGEIVQIKEKYQNIGGSDRLRKIPFVRGPLIFLDSMKLGMSTLTWSASFFEEDPSTAAGAAAAQDDTGADASAQDDMKADAGKKSSAGEKAVMGATIMFAVALAVGLFIVLPTVLVKLLRRVISSGIGISLLEGLIRMVVFVGYLALIAQMKDIKRVFMYHGAEHKCINCIEHGLPLTVENAAKSSRFHKRCGTSFILFSLLVSIFVGIFLPKEPVLLRIGTKLLALPVILSLSYEFIRLAGSSENPVVSALSKPGLWLQRLTTREPDESMLEVGIASTEAVFDWETWEKENFG
ncbi:MAG: DUF1385 domain-containing protein [Lachnospiraceae bacterium]|nr:DUF1385 domain-containing protein [Lachnospiraceae bacterium]